MDEGEGCGVLGRWGIGPVQIEIGLRELDHAWDWDHVPVGLADA